MDGCERALYDLATKYRTPLPRNGSYTVDMGRDRENIQMIVPIHPNLWERGTEEVIGNRTLLKRARMVSRSHARLFVTDNGVDIQDLGSRYGTVVKRGEEHIRVDRTVAVPLESGDYVMLGEAWELVYGDGADCAVARVWAGNRLEESPLRNMGREEDV